MGVIHVSFFPKRLNFADGFEFPSPMSPPIVSFPPCSPFGESFHFGHFSQMGFVGRFGRE